MKRTSTGADASGVPTVHERVAVSRALAMISGSRTNSVASLTVTPIVSPGLAARLPRSRLRLLAALAISTPFRVHVVRSSWNFGCCVSTHTTSSGPTWPSGVCESAIAFAVFRPAIRYVMFSRPTWSK